VITVAEIKEKAENFYREFLGAIVSKENLFPKIIRSDKSFSKDFVESGKQKAEIIEHSKDRKGFGYTINYRTVNTKRHSTQDVIDEISFKSEIDFLKFIRKESEAEIFRKNSDKILARFPELLEWIKKYPLKVVQYADIWEQLLIVCNYFQQNPKPNLYIRELPAVHTKFIETNKGILLEILNRILQASDINQEFNTVKDFEKRFGLKFNQSQIRVRVLDKIIAHRCLSGLTDVVITQDEFCNLQIPCKKVFILENKTNFSNLMNFLTLPQMENTIGIFGSGFMVANLKNAWWLAEKEIYYWGDIDTHGLQILSQIRGYFPNTKSIMMDFETLNTFKDDWSNGEPTAVTSLSNLTADEQKLFLFVKGKGIEPIRLEQEKISHEYVLRQISQLYNSSLSNDQHPI
jgi:hypothetical protein